MWPRLWLATILVTVGGSSVITGLAAQLFLSRRTEGTYRLALILVGVSAILLGVFLARRYLASSYPAAHTPHGRDRTAEAVVRAGLVGSGLWFFAVLIADRIGSKSGVGALQLLSFGGGAVSLGFAMAMGSWLRHGAPIAVDMVGKGRQNDRFAWLHGPRIPLGGEDSAMFAWTLAGEPQKWFELNGGSGLLLGEGVFLLGATENGSKAPSAVVHLSRACKFGCPRAVVLEPGNCFQIIAGEREIMLFSSFDATLLEDQLEDQVEVVSEFARNLQGEAFVEFLPSSGDRRRLNTIRHSVRSVRRL